MNSEIGANRSRETRFWGDQRDCQAASGRGDESALRTEKGFGGDTRRFGGRGSVSKSEPPPVSPGSGRERSIFIREPKSFRPRSLAPGIIMTILFMVILV